MQIPIVSGIYADTTPDFRTSYPVNLVPVPKSQGVSDGYLRPAEGLVSMGEGPGVSRGAINWNGVCYRVMGNSLVTIDPSGNLATLGNIPGTGLVSMSYSFDRLAIAADDKLFYYDGSVLTQVTDPDLGSALTVIWVDGYFMTTDGEFLIVTELNDPTAVDPLKYGSSEADPDPVLGLCKLRREIYAFNRYTTEVFSNVGSAGFPFQRVNGAQITKGAVGAYACAQIGDALAFVGGGRNEDIGVYLTAGGSATKVSTRDIDIELNALPVDTQGNLQVETMSSEGHQTVLVHLPNRTWCYDVAASGAIGQSVWYSLCSGVNFSTRYRGRHMVQCYGQWLAADSMSGAYGRIDKGEYAQWGEKVAWEFGTPIIYSDAKGAIVHELELVSLTGNAPLGASPKVSAEYSSDGVTWSQPRWIDYGTTGNRAKRLRWTRQGQMQQRRMYRFRGDSDAPLAPARLEARIEGLAW